MSENVYTGIAEMLRERGGITQVGVVTAPEETAVIYAGSKVLKKYFDGTKQLAVIFTVTGMDAVSRQRELAERLTEILERLEGSDYALEGISQPRVKINSLPAPTTKNERYYIYAASVEIDFYTKKGMIL